MFKFLFKRNDESSGFDEYINNDYQEDNNFNNNLDSNNVLQEPDYTDAGFKNLVIKTTKSKWFLPVVIALILIIIFILVFFFWYFSIGTLKDVKVNFPDIVYLGEDTDISVKAIGKGNLRSTNFHFTTSNTSIADVYSKATIKGKKAKNKIIPISTGKFALYVDADLGDNKINTKQKEIVVCKVLKESSVQSSTLNIENGQIGIINIDLGTNEECYKNIKYKIENNDIFEIDENGNIITKKAGTSNLNISDGHTNIDVVVNVIDSNKTVGVKSLKLNKSSLTLEMGSTEKLIPTIEPNNASNKAIIWSTSNESVVTVSNNGVVKAIGKGLATITAKTVDGNYQASVVVKVDDKNGSNDNVAPKIKSILMYSNNNNKSLATTKDIITVVVEFDEVVTTKPQIEIAGKIAEVNNGTTKFIAAVEVVSSMRKGEASLKISNYKDKAGNTGNIATNVTSGKKVTIYTLSSWGNPTTATCSDSELCKSATLYRTRTINTAYGNWGSFTTESCVVSDTCMKIQLYKTRTKTYSNWSNISDKACSLSETCQAVTSYKTRTKKINVYMDSTCGNNKQIGSVCNRDGYFLHEGACTVADCNVAYDLWCITSLRCEETIYSNWSNLTTTKCTDASDVCQSAVGYQTRTINYGNWSDWSDTKCDTNDKSLCQTTYGYQTRTKSVSYGNWSNWSTKSCSTSNKETCQSTSGFLTRSRITK